MDSLNEKQKKAVFSESRNIVCVAGPGTGKTHVLTSRIYRLVKEKNVPPEKILAITFTKKARAEMLNRLAAKGVEGVNIHTFNSFCENFLKKNEQKIYSGKMRVMTNADKIFALNMVAFITGENIDALIQNYFTEQQIKNKDKTKLFNSFLNDCFDVIEFFKLKNQNLADFRDYFKGTENYTKADILYRVSEALLKYFKMQGLRDYTDQLIDTINSFQKFPYLIPSFEHVFVDEYQDVNALQVRILQLLQPKNLFVVGDPRQAIFSWRGSDLKFFMNFQEFFGEYEKIELTLNYRSGSEILNLMNLIMRQKNYSDLKGLEKSSEVDFKEFANEQEELKHVASFLNNLENEELSKIVVLARTNKQLSNLSKLLSIKHYIKTDLEDFQEGVALSTIHAAKGTEADIVWLIGASTRYFPCKSSGNFILERMGQNNYNKHEEELRLFYVAVSRPKNKLIISYSGKPTSFLENILEVLRNN